MATRKTTPKTTAKPPKPEPVDFDAIRAQRRRVLGEVPPVKIGGKNYTLAPTLPLAVTDYFAENAKQTKKGTTVLLSDMQHLLRLLFGEKQWAEIATVIDLAEVPVLFNTVFDTYRESVGESSASGQS